MTAFWDTIPFAKAHVSGNDFVIMDRNDIPVDVNDGELARQVCLRSFGIGGDQLLIIECADRDVDLRVMNPDGSASSFCGNACLAAASYVFGDEGGRSEGAIYVAGRRYTVFRRAEDWGLALPVPDEVRRLDPAVRSGESDYFVRNGTVHRVVLSLPQVSELAETGQRTSLAQDVPEQTNVMFLSEVSEEGFRMTPWERGGTGLSNACASGASAAAWVMHAAARCGRDVRVRCPGGDLHVRVRADGTDVFGVVQQPYNGFFRRPRGAS